MKLFALNNAIGALKEKREEFNSVDKYSIYVQFTNKIEAVEKKRSELEDIMAKRQSNKMTYLIVCLKGVWMLCRDALC